MQTRCRYWWVIACLAISWGCVEHASVEAKPIGGAVVNGIFDHQRWNKVLASFVNDRGLVDYQRLAKHRQDLDHYVGQLATASPVSHPKMFPTREHKIAYWINAYNALMVRAVVDHYPIKSVTEIKVAHGVFRRLTFPVGGRAMTLDDIEKGVLLKKYKDARIHFALTCASLSCPYLDTSAYVAKGLSRRLDKEGRHFLNSPDGIQFDSAGNRLRLSRYFEWYAKDFAPSPRVFIQRYLNADNKKTFAKFQNAPIDYLPYDWRLNDSRASWAAGRHR